MAPAGLRGGAVGVEGAIGGVEHCVDGGAVDVADVQVEVVGVAEERFEGLEVTTGDDGFEDESFGVCGRDDRLECFNSGEALGVSARARPLLGDAPDIVAAPPLLEAEERTLRDGDWTYCGYEGDLKSSGERALSEEEDGRGIISDEVVVDDDDDEVLMPGGAGFMAAFLDHTVVYGASTVTAAVVGGLGKTFAGISGGR